MPVGPQASHPQTLLQEHEMGGMKYVEPEPVHTHKLMRQRGPVTESLRDLRRRPVASTRLLGDAHNVRLCDFNFSFAQKLLDVACDVSLFLVRWKFRLLDSPFCGDRVK